MSLKEITLDGEQKKVLDLPITGTTQIKGCAGSGKTTVAIYRLQDIISRRNDLFEGNSICIVSFNNTLINYISRLVGNVLKGLSYSKAEKLYDKFASRDTVYINTFHKLAYAFLKSKGVRMQTDDKRSLTILGREQVEIINEIKEKYSASHGIARKSSDFFIEEISWIKGQMIASKDEYLEVKRVGRGTKDRVTKEDKNIIWDIYADYQAALNKNHNYDFDDYALMCLEKIGDGVCPIFSHMIIDEAQDLSKAQIMTLQKLVKEDGNITIIADAAQRIYKSGFVWSELGINVRGNRTVVLSKNYRNSKFIAQAAMSLIDNEEDKSDFTPIEAARADIYKPTIVKLSCFEEQIDFIVNKIKELDVDLDQIVILHRGNVGVANIKKALDDRYILCETMNVQYQFPVFDRDEEPSVNLCTLSSIKGLEFDYVFICDLNEGVIPSKYTTANKDDDISISTERRLLYTAMTRAKKGLYLLSSDTPSMFLDEINPEFVEIEDKRYSESSDEIMSLNFDM